MFTISELRRPVDHQLSVADHGVHRKLRIDPENCPEFPRPKPPGREPETSCMVFEAPVERHPARPPRLQQALYLTPAQSAFSFIPDACEVLARELHRNVP